MRQRHLHRRRRQNNSTTTLYWRDDAMTLISILALSLLLMPATTSARFPRWEIQGPVVTILVKDRSSSNGDHPEGEIDMDDYDSSIHTLDNQHSVSLSDLASSSGTTETTTTAPNLPLSSTETNPITTGASGSTTTITTPNPKIPLARRILSLPKKVVSQQQPRAWMNQLSSVRPKAVWTARTREPPLPVWFPALQQLGASWGYEYHKLKARPTWVEWTAKFSKGDLGDLWVQPSWDFWEQEQTKKQQLLNKRRSSKKGSKSATLGNSPFHLQLQFARGSSFLKARLSPRQRYSGTSPSHHFASSKAITKTGISSLLESLSGSFTFDLPYSAVRTVRLTPHLDFANSDSYDFTCNVEARTGGAGRTKAVLHLEYENPTLAVVHQLDERNTVSPEIHIYNARIKYQWDYRLGGSSSVRTQIDPHDCIAVTWTDESARDGGTWVTDLRLPLTGSLSSLAADVRIQRQFRF
mmetsp:Transcript_5246/g.14739  ORF Transcript_5246/g.14739 Transcript_5246/m.14739 type:complete len:468 (+) Transcript_5246:136-1539(+)